MTIAHKIMSTSSSQVIDAKTIQLDDMEGPSGAIIGTRGNFDDSGIEFLLK